MNTQIIISPSGERLVVIAEADYARLLEAADDNADRAALRAFREKLQAGTEELVPSTIVDRLLAGENPIRVWREHRGMSVKTLVEHTGLAQSFISQLETGQRDGTMETLKKIAAVLQVDIDDLTHPSAENLSDGALPPNVRAVEALILRTPGLTEHEIAQELHGQAGYQQKVNAACRLLVRQGRVERQGRGGNGDAYRYFPRIRTAGAHD